MIRISRQESGTHLDLPERDEEALLELGVEAEQPGGLPEVAAGRGERVHGGGAGFLSSPAPTSAPGKKEGGRTETGARERDRGAGGSGGQKGQGAGKKGGFFLLFSGDRG